MKKENQEWAHLGLEEIVKITNKIGLEYAEARKNADFYELMKPTTRSKIAMRIDDGMMSEAKLKRLTEIDPEYVEFLSKMVAAKLASDRLRVRYESYKNLFEAKRSLLSYQKAELKLI